MGTAQTTAACCGGVVGPAYGSYKVDGYLNGVGKPAIEGDSPVN